MSAYQFTGGEESASQHNMRLAANWQKDQALKLQADTSDATKSQRNYLQYKNTIIENLYLPSGRRGF